MPISRDLLARVKGVIEDIARRRGIDVEAVILFGSRARGDFREDSDWDILAITRSRYGRRVVRGFVLEVRRALVDMGVTPEIIVADRDLVERYRNYTGYIYHYALGEGIVL